MSKPRIGLALYTIRDKLKSQADFARCLAQVKKIGYDGVEGSAADPAITIPELAKILQGEGLTCTSIHAGESDLRAKLDTVIANAKTLGCGAVVFPWLDSKYYNEAGVREIARFLDETGGRLSKEGIQFLYHNHHVEFNRVGKKTILETIYELTNPKNVMAELDTYWVQHGGGDPVEWIGRMKGRSRHLHCKDKAMLGAECVFAEVGEGNLDWRKIVKAAKSAGIEWYIVEQDTSRRDTLVSAEMSYKTLKGLLK